MAITDDVPVGSEVRYAAELLGGNLPCGVRDRRNLVRACSGEGRLSTHLQHPVDARQWREWGQLHSGEP